MNWKAGRPGVLVLLAAVALGYMSVASCSSGGGGGAATPASEGGTGTDTGTAAPSPSPSPTVSPASETPSITLTRYASGFTRPTHIANAGDGSNRIFIVEKGGVVRIVKDGAVSATPFLDISDRVTATGPEQGLLGLAFPPVFASKRYFYIDYTGRSGIGDTVVARIPVTGNPDVADPAGATTILTVPQPFANHNGGQLAFGPDGLLYVGMGDGGSGGDPQNNAQNRTRLLGKILRLDVESTPTGTYAIPTGNPFSNEVWSYGLRNPWRFSFDRGNGDLYIADVGEDLYEEINVQPADRAGDNYGWNVMEGMHCYGSTTCDQSGLTLPAVEYGREDGNCSVTGGFVYRGSRMPALQGFYIYGDFCSGRIWGMRRSGTTWQNTLLLDSQLRISTFGEDEAGNIYVADYGTGDIYRIDLR